MKRLAYILSLTFVAAGLSGCENFLEQNPYNSLSSETVWLSDDTAEMQINGLYKLEQSVWRNQGYAYKFTCWGPDGYDYHRDRTVETGSMSASYGPLDELYSQRYTTINAATTAIVNLTGNENITPELRDRMMGEAYFFRGFAYFMLWQLFGEVPVFDHILGEREEVPKSTKEELVNRIKDDFISARELLPLHYNTDYGRITQGAAQAMIGKTLLYNEEWEDAAAELAKLMSAPYQYELFDDYAHLFDWKYEKWDVNKEFIYAMRFTAEIGYGTANDSWFGNRCSYINGEDYVQGSSLIFDISTYKDGSSIDLTSKPGRESYPDEVAFGNALIAWYDQVINDPKGLDYRIQSNLILPSALFYGKDNTYWKVNWPYEAHANDDPNPALRTTFPNYACYSWRKFVNVGEEGYWAYQGPNDLPLIRYADVLLQYAEALNEHLAVPSQDVYDAVNAVRSRVGMNDLAPGMSQDDMRRAIRLERFYEFAGEGHLFFDVRRWKTAHTSDPVFGMNHTVYQFTGDVLFDRVFPEKYYKWPIPQGALDTNLNLTQHDEWK